MKKYYRTVLVIEDDTNDQELIRSAFAQLDVATTIHTVIDGAEAIAYMCGEGQYANREKFAYPTFIITDLKMPRADGFAVLEFLKKNPDWNIIPTVVLSASADLDDIKKSYMLGASSYHVKPHTFVELQKQLQILHDYWLTCEVPEVDMSGKQFATESRGRLGERFEQSISEETKPHH